MNQDKLVNFMKKHPPWFMLDIHPMRHAKKISEEEQEDEQEIEVEKKQ